MKKRVISLCMVLCMMLAMTGCTSKNETKFERGTWENNVYTNASLGIQITVPEEWGIMTDEELAATMEEGKEAFDEESQKLADISKFKVVNDMGSYDLTTGSNILLTAENLSLSLGGKKVSEDEYIDIVEEQLNSNALYTYDMGDRSDVELGGLKFRKLPLSLSTEGIEITQDYYVCKVGNYMVSFIVTCFPGGEDVCAGIIEGISATGEAK